MKSFKFYLSEALDSKRIIMIGGPGSGKSTYSKLITKELGIPHISTGVIMRDLSKTDDKVKDLVSKGVFVPTDIVVKAVQDRLKKPDADRGYILDGFPRNIEQAKLMKSNNIGHDYVIYLEVSPEEVMKRLTSRGREDDKPEIIKNRLKVFEKETAPLLDYYKDEIIRIRAEGGTPEEITKTIMDKIQ